MFSFVADSSSFARKARVANMVLQAIGLDGEYPG